MAVVIIFALVVPAWGSRRVPGAAQMSPTPGPPRVGDCLDAVPSRRSALDYLPPILAAPTGPCGEVNHAEVVAVAQDVGTFPWTVENGMSRPEALACDPLVRQYLGWPVPEAENGEDASGFVDWRPWNTISSGLIGPDLRQYFAGQQWVACVAYPEFAPFSGSIRGSVRHGRSAVSYAACLPVTPGPSGELLSCASSHQTELFGWTTQTAVTADPSTSCSELAQRLTGMPDPTDGGALMVTLLDGNDQGAVGDVATSAGLDHRLVCAIAVSGPRRLVGTLIGIGDNELPWE